MRPKNSNAIISVVVLTCLSTSVFAQVTGVLPLTLPSDYITTDYNLDGVEDIVYTIEDTIYIATRMGYTATPLLDFVIDDPGNVRVGDIDGDRFPEVVFSNVGMVRYVQNNNGQPGDIVVIESSGQRYEWSAVFDYDQDGDGDLLQNVRDLSLYIIENDNGTFLTEAKVFLTHTQKIETQTDEYFCDINQDGFIDAWLFQPGSGMLLLWNYGDGRFEVTQEYDLTYQAAFDTDDINGDGFPELFQVSQSFGDPYHLIVNTNRYGSIQDYRPYVMLDGQLVAMDVIDVNQDLFPDVILADSTSITALYANQDTFDHVVIWTSQDTTLGHIAKIDVTDLDEDDALEIIVVDINGEGRILTTTWQSSGSEYSCNTLPDPLDCPPGDITFATQAALDQFLVDYPNCRILNGKLAIQDAVTDLDPLVNVIAVKGSMEITQSQFDSLHDTNLRFVHGNLRIADNTAITKIFFDELRHVRDTLLISANANLLVIDSFHKFERAGQIRIEANPTLKTIRGFSHTMHTPLTALLDNPVLDTVIAFNTIANYYDNPYDLPNLLLEGNVPGVFYIDGILDTVYFQHTHAPNLSWLKFTRFETLILDGVSGITSLQGMSTQYRFHVIAANCPDLVSLGGNVELSELEIRNCGSFNSLFGFRPASSMTRLALIENPLLTNLNSMPQVPRLQGELHLEGNPLLSSISGFNLQYPSTLRSLIIRDNTSLAFCDVNWVCDFLERDDDVIIDGNAVGCHTAQAVNAACGFVPPINTDIADDPGGPIFYPNPADTKIDITSDEVPHSLRIYDGCGRLINEALHTREMRLDAISNGIYTLVISQRSGPVASRMVVAH